MIGFWKTTDEYGSFSNWYKSSFTLDGKVFGNSEQAFMYKKAVLFQDFEIAEKILKNSNPAICKNLGRLVKSFDAEVFEKKRYEIMYECVYAKFSQNSDLKELLLSTKEELICEASPKDSIWGIGISMDHPYFNHPEQWKGLNLLGKVLMDVRARLRES